MNDDRQVEHTPEPWDLYKYDDDEIYCYVGRHVSVTDPAYKHNIFGRHECYHVNDNWFKSAHYLGNALRCVKACAGLGDDLEVERLKALEPKGER